MVKTLIKQAFQGFVKSNAFKGYNLDLYLVAVFQCFMYFVSDGEENGTPCVTSTISVSTILYIKMNILQKFLAKSFG